VSSDRHVASSPILGAAAFLGVLGGLLVGLPPGAAARSSATTVRVSISDARVTLSKHTAPVGQVLFDVTNTGRRPLEFRVAGVQTPILGRGRHATLKVDFRATGSYPYGVLDPAHPGKKLAGVLTVVGAPPAPPAARPTSQPPTSVTGTPCTSPSPTTVAVTMTDVLGGNGFVFTPAAFPCGTVTFVITNTGQSAHVLQVTYPNAAKVPASPTVDPNKTATLTVNLTVSGTYGWYDGYGEGDETTYGNLTVQ
jgi:hypothetical protein